MRPMHNTVRMSLDAIPTWEVSAFLPIFGAVGSNTRHMSWKAGCSVVEYGRPAAATHFAAALLNRFPNTVLAPADAVGTIPYSASVWVLARPFAAVLLMRGLGWNLSGNGSPELAYW